MARGWGVGGKRSYSQEEKEKPRAQLGDLERDTRAGNEGGLERGAAQKLKAWERIIKRESCSNSIAVTTQIMSEKKHQGQSEVKSPLERGEEGRLYSRREMKTERRASVRKNSLGVGGGKVQWKAVQ